MNEFTLSGNDNKAKHLSSLRPCLHGERKILEDETTFRLGYMKTFQSGRLTSGEGKEENCRPLAAERRPPPRAFLLFVCLFFVVVVVVLFFNSKWCHKALSTIFTSPILIFQRER